MNTTKVTLMIAGLAFLAMPVNAIPLDVGGFANAVCSYGMAHADAVGLYTSASASGGLYTVSMSGVGASQATAFGPGPWSASATSYYGIDYVTASCYLPSPIGGGGDGCTGSVKDTQFNVQANALDAGTTTYRGNLFTGAESGNLYFAGVKDANGQHSQFATAAQDGQMAFRSDATTLAPSEALMASPCPALTVSFAPVNGRSADLTFDEWLVA